MPTPPPVVRLPPRRRALAAALVLIPIALSTACVPRVSRVVAAGSELYAPAGAAAPASVDTSTTTETIPLPSGTILEAPGADPAAPPLRIVLPSPSSYRRDTTSTAARTSTGHAPPTAAALATASGVRLFWIAGLACLLAAGLLAWRAHWLAAVFAGAAGIALPVLASVLSSGVAILSGAVMLSLAGAFVSAWHLLKKKEQR